MSQKTLDSTNLFLISFSLNRVKSSALLLKPLAQLTKNLNRKCHFTFILNYPSIISSHLIVFPFRLSVEYENIQGQALLAAKMGS